VTSNREDLDMTLLSTRSLAWLGVVTAVLIVLAAPVLIAAIRGAEPISLVVLLTVLALGTGPVTWVPALIAAFALPRSRPPAGRSHRAATPARLPAGQRAVAGNRLRPGRADPVPDQARQAPLHRVNSGHDT
jgi:hypothetical protein